MANVSLDPSQEWSPRGPHDPSRQPSAASTRAPSESVTPRRRSGERPSPPASRIVDEQIPAVSPSGGPPMRQQTRALHCTSLILYSTDESVAMMLNCRGHAVVTQAVAIDSRLRCCAAIDLPVELRRVCLLVKSTAYECDCVVGCIRIHHQLPCRYQRSCRAARQSCRVRAPSQGD